MVWWPATSLYVHFKCTYTYSLKQDDDKVSKFVFFFYVLASLGVVSVKHSQNVCMSRIERTNTTHNK